MFLLTEAEVEKLTDYRKPALQRRALTAMGIPYLMSTAGKPKVLRSSVEKKIERNDIPEGTEREASNE